MSDSSVISACAKKRTRTSTPLREPEPEFGARFFELAENGQSIEKTNSEACQRVSGVVTKWRRCRDTSRGTGIVAAGIEITVQAAERFWSRFEFNHTTGCLEWTGATFDGYGRFVVGRTDFGVKRSTNFQTHKLAFILMHGFDPLPLCVLHRCDNRLCGNPGHLFLGTRLDNMRDAIAKGRMFWQRGGNNFLRVAPSTGGVK